MNRLARNALFCAGGAIVGWTLAQRAIQRTRWFDYRGKVAIVAGGSRGLGLEIARRLVARGAKVAICARTEDDLQAAAEELGRMGGDMLPVVCDITQFD